VNPRTTVASGVPYRAPALGRRCPFDRIPFIALLLLRAPFEGLSHVVRRPFWALLIWGNIYPSSLISQVVFPIGFSTEDSL
jgi:hypothetical protein